jgi:L-alanine-DL-glutamate epimerase-like enolase superfamily enzyme
MRRRARATGLPMKMDENAHDTASLLKAYELGCMDAVALKLSKFGGLSAMRRARDLCLHLGAKMCVEDTWGSGHHHRLPAAPGRGHTALQPDERVRPVRLCGPPA